MEVKTSQNAQQQLPKVLRSKELEWINLDLTNSGDVSWLKRDSGLGEHIVKRIIERRETIVRFQLGEGTIARILYAKLGKDPSDDQIGDLGFWIEARRVVTFRRGPPGSLIDGLEVEFGSDGAPSTAWEFFASAVSCVTDHIEKNLTLLESTVDRLEDRMLQRGATMPIDELAALRKRFIYVRRYKAPLAGLVDTIAGGDVLDMDEETRSELKDAAASLMQSQRLSELYIERANNVHEYFENQLSDRLDKATFRLTIVATLFLPATFITGLLGINVAGIPGAQHPPYAFWLVCLSLVVLAIVSAVIVSRAIKR